MQVADGELMGQPQARGCIYACLDAEDPRAAVEELLAGEGAEDDPDILKVAEYALLKAPIIEGVRLYLENPFSYAEGDESSEINRLAACVGGETADRAQEVFDAGPDKDFTTEINKRRAWVMKRGGVNAAGIEGIPGKISMAANSAVLTNYAAAVLNAAEIADRQPGTSEDRERFIEAIKLSGELPRGMSRIHLQQLPTTHMVMQQHALAISNGHAKSSISANNLRVDDDGTARLNTPIKDWRYPVGGYHAEGVAMSILDTIDSKELRDVQIGCLLSFDPALATAYYRHCVDLMERYQVWPEELKA